MITTCQVGGGHWRGGGRRRIGKDCLRRRGDFIEWSLGQRATRSDPMGWGLKYAIYGKIRHGVLMPLTQQHDDQKEVTERGKREGKGATRFEKVQNKAVTGDMFLASVLFMRPRLVCYSMASQ
jgi:hypothetical protein